MGIRWVFLGHLPLMTSRGHFLINGVPRVVIHQLVRRPGIYYHHRTHKILNKAGQQQVYRTYFVDIIVHRGAWLRFELDKKQQLWACARRVTRIPIVSFFNIFGLSRKRLQENWVWRSVDRSQRRERGTYPLSYLKKKFFQGSLEASGREQINTQLGGLEMPYALNPLDFLQIVRSLLKFASQGNPNNDVDHLNQKCVRGIGDLMLEPIQKGMQRFSNFLLINQPKSQQNNLIHFPTTRPITGALREFFLTNPLSQFMDETNPLAELTHKRRLSALGPGGVRRDAAGMSIRGIHPTYYGRICPIETPEGQNAGLVNSLSTWASVAESGILLAPFQSIFKGQVQRQQPPCFLTAGFEEQGLVIMPDTPCSKLGFFPTYGLITRHGRIIQKNTSNQLKWVGFSSLSILSIATSLIPFLEHDDANRALMGSNMQRQAVPLVTTQKAYVQTQLESRVLGNSQAGFQSPHAGLIIYTSKSYIEIYAGPFGPHIQTNKNYLKRYRKNLFFTLTSDLGKFNQSVRNSNNLTKTFLPNLWLCLSFLKPLSRKKLSPTNWKYPINPGLMGPYPSLKPIDLSQKNFKAVLTPSFHQSIYRLRLQHFERSNQGTLINQKPIQNVFRWIQQGDLIADSATSACGTLALGRELWIAYMPWEGYNFEDAVVLNQRLVNDDVLTSLHIERLTAHIREVQHGFERVTINFPGSSSLDRLRLDSNGIIRLGTWVQEGDVLVGKITPIQPRSLYPHERLLYDIVGQSTECIKDSSLRVPKGIQGRVLRLTVSYQRNSSELKPECIQVYIGQKRTIKVGDKVAGRHGNKGVISKILPTQDMPYLISGQVIDLVLNPLGVPSRMNVGQLFECLLGLAGHMLNEQFTLIPFDEECGFDASRSFVYSKLLQIRQKTRHSSWFSERAPGKIVLFDGRSGQKFIQTVTVGCTYILKLIHLVDEKIHARSTGPYSLITQQPLRGRSKHGGQRLGEMEVWALEGFGSAYTLQELLTVKSDDARGRNQVMETILKNTPMRHGTPESFKVLLRELQALCLDIKICRRIFWS